MRILVACEESQAVTLRLREKGHEAYSCDIIECSGGHPEWHLQTDVTQLLKQQWDAVIAFPPCTHLAVSGARHFETKRADGRQRDGISFFGMFLKLDHVPIVVIENPVGILSGKYVEEYFPDLCEKYGLPVKPSQIIQPYEFGDPFEKKTCLWIKGVSNLSPTNIVKPESRETYESGRSMAKWFADSWRLPPEERAKVRSKTFPGIAQAIVDQWF